MFSRACQILTLGAIVIYGLWQYFVSFFGELLLVECFSYVGFIDFKGGYLVFSYDIPNPYYQPRELLYVYR